MINRFEITSASDHVYGAVAGGISAQLGHHVSIEGSARTTVSRRDGNDYGGFAGLRLTM